MILRVIEQLATSPGAHEDTKMANWSLPTITDLYTNIITYFRNRDIDNARMFSTAYTIATNIETGTIRWNDTNKNWEKYGGASWSVLSSLYGVSVSGNAATATKLATSRTINGTSFDGTAAINIASRIFNSNPTDTLMYPMLVGSNAVGNYQANTDPAYSYNSSTGALTATYFVGNGASITNLNMANAAAGTLAITRGGTGVTTSTGTGSTVRGTSPTLSSPVITDPIITGFVHYVSATTVGGTLSTTLLPSGWTISRTAVGRILITHNLSLANGHKLIVSGTANESSLGIISTRVKAINSFEIVMTAGGANADMAFTIMIIDAN